MMSVRIKNAHYALQSLQGELLSGHCCDFFNKRDLVTDCDSALTSDGDMSLNFLLSFPSFIPLAQYRVAEISG